MFKTINGGKMPERETKYSACIDLYASHDVTIAAGYTEVVGLGVVIDDISGIVSEVMDTNGYEFKKRGNLTRSDWEHVAKSKYYLQLNPRSSLRAKGLISHTGIIDLDFEDEIKIIIHNPFNRTHFYHGVRMDMFFKGTKNTGVLIKKGDKIAQITLMEHKGYLFGIETDNERTGGIGSTDKENQ